MPERSYANGGQYRYGFNGKEKDDEVKGAGAQYDYGFRVYDPRIARFLSVDPLIQTYPWWTPYQYAGNSPISFIDVDGAELSKKLDEWFDVKLNPVAAGFIDGLTESFSIIAMGQLTYDLIENENGFRDQFIEAIKTAATDPVAFANMVYEDYKSKAKNILAWNEQGQYEAGYMGGELTGTLLSGGAGKIIGWANKFAAIKKAQKFLNDLPIVKKLVGSPCGCLTEETQVLTEEGLKSISLLRDGDIVQSYNDTLDFIEVKPIYKPYNVVSDSLIYIQLNNETIRATNDHPFLTKKGWIEANHLSHQDSLLTKSGNYVAIVSVNKKFELENVFNFEVKDFHTYYIGKNNVVVHNAIGGPCNIVGGMGSGFYRVTSKDGKFYIGKGKFDRSKTSLKDKGGSGGGVEWWSVDKGFGKLSAEQTAFVYEHLLLNSKQVGGTQAGGKSLNIIESPGKKIFEGLNLDEQKAITEQFNKTVGSTPATATKP